ncbi:receptor activity-modifying protein 2 isoform X2 [Notolabrus celidotus]|uniref:receptor activity-modifying protein 2 isoform X2 n=1 Tax=Notolabrus celidotus TaxID=1203425 RepID=UPI00149084A7|nr:receptor activity-modifying protein 2 isoform X2 [Notolabrus celidotus]
MRASCCFIKPSCKKVEICNPYPAEEANRALSGTMTAATFSPMFSRCFVTLLLWGCTTVVCLVDEKLAIQPTTTTEMMAENATYGESTIPLAHTACGNNSHSCEDYCDICMAFGGSLMDCLSTLFEHLCLHNFKGAMASVNSTDWCIWGKVRGMYSNMSHCTEEISDCLLIPWPNPLVEQTFVNIHSTFFKDCPSEELSDPPPAIVFALVITPICLIPVMVSLVVLKTKNGDGSS